jgi:sulfite exporter TauE/SafE
MGSLIICFNKIFNGNLCMSLIPQISNPYLGAFIGGLLYGLAVCTASCLPVVTSYIAGVGAGFTKGVKVTLIFNSGRILAYTLIGALLGLFSGLFRVFISEAAISPFQVYSSFAFGIVTIIIGAAILIRARKPCECTLDGVQNSSANSKVGRFGVNFGAFSLGLSRGLIVCPPLIALLLYSLPFTSPIGSVVIALLFGFGTALSPIILLGGVTGWLLNKAPLFRKWISLVGGYSNTSWDSYYG